MKKIKILACAFGALAMLASCSGNGQEENKPLSLSDYSNLTAGDSLAFYYTQLRVLDYWQDAMRDTTFQSREARDQYLKGLRAGYDAVKDNDAYNQGYYMGLQLAIQLQDANKEMETTCNKQIVFDTFEYGLRNDSIINPVEANEGFSMMQETLMARKEVKDKAAALELIQKEAKSKGWTLVKDDLYAGKVEKAGTGAVVRNGEVVSISVSVSTMDGVEINRQENESAVVGQAYIGPIAQALATMKVGETRTFYVPAPSIMGRAYARYGMKPTDIIAFRLSVGPGVAKPVVEDEAGN